MNKLINASKICTDKDVFERGAMSYLIIWHSSYFKVDTIKAETLVHEIILVLSDLNAGPMNHMPDALSTDPARKHSLIGW